MAESSKSYESRILEKCTNCLISAAREHLQTLCNDLLSEELIDDEILAKATDGMPGRETFLLRAIRSKVEMDANNYWKFMDVLKNRHPTFSEAIDTLDKTYFKEESGVSRGYDAKKVKQYMDDLKAAAGNQVISRMGWPYNLAGSNGSYFKLSLINQSSSFYRHSEVVDRHKHSLRSSFSMNEIYQQTQMTSLENMCNPPKEEDTRLKILVDGAPGVGKTTLCRKVQKDWARGELLKGYDLVVLLNLRDKGISAAGSIDEWFKDEKGIIHRDVVKYINETDGRKVLLIFDGFDELSYQKRNEKSLFLDIIKGRRLRNCSVIITSRPYASQSLVELAHRHIEILGYTEKEIHSCIEKNLQGSHAVDLNKQLKARLDLASLCRIPLNCSILIYVYKRDQYNLPRTVTELYERLLIHSFIQCYEKRQESCKLLKKVKSLNDLPQCTPTFCVRCCFKALCKLAYDGIECDKLIYDDDEVKKAFFVKECSAQLSEKEQFLNLMTGVKTMTGTATTSVFYSFYHLTIQEFLAAQWIANFSSIKIEQFFEEHLHNDQYCLILKFLSGITNLSFQNADTMLKSFLDFKGRQGFRFLCCLLYESNQPLMCKTLVNIMYPGHEMNASLVVGDSYSFDCLALANLIVCSNCQWRSMEIGGNHLRALHTIIKDLGATVSACRFKMLVVSIELETFEYLHLLGELAPYYDDVTININLKEDDCIKASMQPVTTADRYSLKQLKLKYSNNLKIVANNCIFPQLFVQMLNEIQCTSGGSSNLVHITLGRIAHSTDNWLEETGSGLVEMLGRNHTLKTFHFLLKDGGHFATDEYKLLEYLAIGVSRNTSIEKLSIGELSDKHLNAFFDHFAKHRNRIRISTLHVYINLKYNIDDFQKFSQFLEHPHVVQMASLNKVIFQLGYDTKAPKQIFSRPCDKKTAHFKQHRYLTEGMSTLSEEVVTEVGRVVTDPFHYTVTSSIKDSRSEKISKHKRSLSADVQRRGLSSQSSVPAARNYPDSKVGHSQFLTVPGAAQNQRPTSSQLRSRSGSCQHDHLLSSHSVNESRRGNLKLPSLNHAPSSTRFSPIDGARPKSSCKHCASNFTTEIGATAEKVKQPHRSGKLLSPFKVLPPIQNGTVPKKD